jgi:two-component system nitrate/nitrite response regulator NarL
MIRLLIADDHKVLLDGFCSISNAIEDISIVETASNGLEAIEHLRKHPDIDIALLDINMPEMNGVEACKVISKSNPSVKVIALSMYNKHSYINNLN